MGVSPVQRGSKEAPVPRPTAWILVASGLALAAASSRPASPEGAPAPGATDDTASRIVPPLGAEDDLRRTAVVRAVERVAPAVVNIATDHVVKKTFLGLKVDPWGDFSWEPQTRRQTVQSIGSGIVVDPEGYVLTNAHVVAQGDKIHVRFGSTPSSQATREEGLLAEVIAEDARSDLALLKIEGGPYPFVELGSSRDLMIGEPAIAIGQPFGLSSTVTTGVVSAKDRTITLPAGNLEGMIQTDAAIDPGNSGGPLLDIRGRLIGLNAAIYGPAHGIGFAIPVDRIKSVVARLIDPVRGSTSWTGFEVSGRGQAVVVEEVVRGGPAERAGLRPGDTLVSVEGAEARSVFGVKRRMLAGGVGQAVRVTVRRGEGASAEAANLEIRVEEEPSLRPALRRAGERLGAEILPVEFRIEGKRTMRFEVKQVDRRGAAARIEVAAADILDTLAGVTLDSAEALESALQAAVPGRPVPIRVFRRTERGLRFADTEIVLD